MKPLKECVLPKVVTPPDRSSTCSSKGTKNTDSSFQSGQSASSSENTNTSGMQVIRKSLTLRGVSEKAAKVILQSWRGSTHKQYSTYLNKWLLFCSSRGFDPYKATPTQTLDFMTELM